MTRSKTICINLVFERAKLEEWSGRLDSNLRPHPPLWMQKEKLVGTTGFELATSPTIVDAERKAGWDDWIRTCDLTHHCGCRKKSWLGRLDSNLRPHPPLWMQKEKLVGTTGFELATSPTIVDAERKAGWDDWIRTCDLTHHCGCRKKSWSGRLDSNQRPHPPQGCALPG